MPARVISPSSPALPAVLMVSPSSWAVPPITPIDTFPAPESTVSA